VLAVAFNQVLDFDQFDPSVVVLYRSYFLDFFRFDKGSYCLFAQSEIDLGLLSCSFLA
jgi:hypothetical protein